MTTASSTLAEAHTVQASGAWETTKLRFLLEVNPATPAKLRAQSDRLVPFIPMEALGEDGSIDATRQRPVGELLTGYSYFANGDVLMAKVTPCFENGKAALVRALPGGRGFGSTEVTTLRASQGLDPAFLYYLVHSDHFRQSSIASMTGAGGLKRVPDEHIRSFEVPVPPEVEQRSIADFLDRETAKIDALIDTQEQLIATLREDRAATITQAVTRGLDPYTKMRASGVQWIGEIPETWNVLRLSWMFGTISGGTTPDSKNLNYYGGEINWVTTGELREGYIEETTSKVTDLALTEHSALRVYEPGSLIIAMYGATIGRLGILSAPACTNQACCVFATPTQTDARFVFYVLQAAREHLLVLASGGGQPNINQDKLRALRVPAPNLVTQRIIAEHLDERCSKIDSLIDKSAEMIEVLREYRSALITNAVTGKIDVREAV